MSVEKNRTDKLYVCDECHYRGVAADFGLFVRCPECKSLRILDATIWDRFGPAVPKPQASEES